MTREPPRPTPSGLESATRPGISDLRIEQIDPTSDDARWCLDAYFAELAIRFSRGFDPAASLPAEKDDLRPPGGAFLVARLGDRPVACGAVKVIAPGTGTLKRMWVGGDARGYGIGRRMLLALEDAARRLGCSHLQLETNGALTEALQLYRSAGYVEVAPFNEETYADHWFEKQLA